MKIHLFFEVLLSIGTIFGTASVVQTVNRYPLYGHFPAIKEKYLNHLQVIGQLLLKPLVYQVFSEHIPDRMVICE